MEDTISSDALSEGSPKSSGPIEKERYPIVSRSILL